MTTKHTISDELLAAYLDSNTTPSESQQVEQAFVELPALFDDFCFLSEAVNLVDDSFVDTTGVSSFNPLSLLTGTAIGGGVAAALAAPMVNPIFFQENDRLSEADPSINTEHNSIIDSAMPLSNQHGEMNPIQQQYSDTCAIKSQQLILNDFGVNVTEDQLVEYSSQRGWYDGNGTAMEDVGKLLADAGIPVTQMADANVYTLVGELAQGHKVIVGVDADELWNKGVMTYLKDVFVGDTPNHALIVSGIDTTDPNNVKVTLTDPGTGDLCKEYPLYQFMDAWQDSKCFMVSTQMPAPLAYNPEMINFDYSAGHIPNIGDMSYQQFTNEYMNISLDTPSFSPVAFDSNFETPFAYAGLMAGDFWQTHNQWGVDGGLEYLNMNDTSNSDFGDDNYANDYDFLT